jgi:hypothetical protein
LRDLLSPLIITITDTKKGDIDMHSYEVKLNEISFVGKGDPKIFLGIWSGNNCTNSIVVKLIRSGQSALSHPPTFLSNPTKFWASTIFVAAQMIRDQSLSGSPPTELEEICPDVFTVEHWAQQWRDPDYEIHEGDLVLAFETSVS